MPVASRAAEVMGTNSVPLHGCLDPAEILANQLVYTSKRRLQILRSLPDLH